MCIINIIIRFIMFYSFILLLLTPNLCLTQSNNLIEQVRLNEFFELYCPETKQELDRIVFKRSIDTLNVTKFHKNKYYNYFGESTRVVLKREPILFEKISFQDSGRYFCLYKDNDYFIVKSILLLVYDIEQKAAWFGDQITLLTNDFAFNSTELVWSIGQDFLVPDNKFFFINESSKDLTILLNNYSFFDTYRLNNIKSGEYILYDVLLLNNDNVKKAPIIQPANMTITVHSSALFECINRNINDEPDNYQWYKMSDNKRKNTIDEIYQDNSYSINQTDLEIKYSSVIVGNGKTLYLDFLQADDSGWYFCCLAYSVDFFDDYEPLMTCSSAYLNVENDSNVISINEHGRITSQNKYKTQKMTALVILFVLITIIVACLSILAIIFLYKKLRVLNNAEKGRQYMAKNELYHSPKLLSNDETLELITDHNTYDVLKSRIGQKEIEKWEIPLGNLKFGHTLGAGAFGLVMYAEETLENDKFRAVAVKKLKEKSNFNTFNELIDELKLMIEVGEHENIINLVGYSVDVNKNSLYIVTEYCQFGNLKDYLRKYYELTSKSYEYTSLYAYQIAKGMLYLHNKEILHRDLAARNILVYDYNLVKIADFGLARNLSTDYYYIQQSDGRFPIKWMAVESLTHNKISKKSDVWSYAVLLWEIYSHGCSPYPSVPPENILRYIQSGNRLEKPQDCDESIYDLMMKCWSFNENDRPYFDYILTQLETHINELMWTTDSNLMTDSMTSTDKKIIKTSSSTYPDSNSTEYTIASNSCRNIQCDIELEPFIDDYSNVADAFGDAKKL